MTEPTDADRERAATTLNYAPDEQVSPMDAEYVDAIAAALAEERARARAPFAALADELERSEIDERLLARNSDQLERRYHEGKAQAWAHASARIRRAAEETP